MKIPYFNFFRIILNTVILNSILFSATPEMMWFQSHGGVEYDSYQAILPFSDEGFLVTGYTSSHGKYLEAYLSKTDAFGVELWQQIEGGNHWDQTNDVYRTYDENIITAGCAYVDNQFDVLAVLSNPEGEQIWRRVYGGISDDGCTSLLPADDGGFYLGGFTEINPGSAKNMLLLRINSEGDSLWARNFGGDDDEFCYAMSFADDGSILMAGSSLSNDLTNRDIYLVKTDQQGNQIWELTIELDYPNYIQAVQADDDNGFILCGTTHQNETDESSDLILIRISSQGYISWIRTFGNSSWDEGYAVAQTSDGGFLGAGTTMSTTENSSNIFLVRVNSSGDSLWTYTHQMPGFQTVNDLVISDENELVLVGSTYSDDTQLADFLIIKFALPAVTINVPDDILSIQDAINRSHNKDTVLVAPGTYNENINFNGKFIFVTSQYIHTKNEEDVFDTVIDGQSSGSVAAFVNGEDSTSVLNGFSLINGSGNSISDNNFSGGGILCLDSSPVISNSIIYSNSVTHFGGGMYCENSAPILKSTLFSENSALNGGAVYCVNSDFSIHNCIITGNSAFNGGGIYILDSSSIFYRCTFIDNSVFQVGGAVFNYNSNSLFVNVTIADNEAGNAGGIRLRSNSDVTIVNSIIWQNLPQQILAAEDGLINYLTAAASDIQGGMDELVLHDNCTVSWAEDNINLDPEFETSSNFPYRLSENSPCLEQGRIHLQWIPDFEQTIPDFEFFGRAPEIGSQEVIYLPGDLNQDGFVNTVDIILLLDFIFYGGQSNLETLIADFDYNDLLDIVDVLQIVDLILNG